VTDANVMLGKIRAAYFPNIFGKEGNSPLDTAIVIEKFSQLAKIIDNLTPEQVAEGFITIAIDNMANALKKISLQRGYNISNYALCTFGGAGGQVACLIADTLGIKTIFLHPYAGVLSAYGMGLADIRVSKESTVEQTLSLDLIASLQQLMKSLQMQAKKELDRSIASRVEKVIKKVSLKYAGTDSSLTVDFTDNISLMRQAFETEYQTRYGFIQSQKELIVELVSVEVIQMMDSPEEALITRARPLDKPPKPVEIVQVFTNNSWQDAPIYLRKDLQVGDIINGSAIIIEKISTIVVEPNWKARLTANNHLILFSQDDILGLI